MSLEPRHDLIESGSTGTRKSRASKENNDSDEHRRLEVHVSFIIEKDGSISEVRAVRDIPGAPELSREAERCVKKLKKFKPAMMGKNPVRLRTVLPIHFKLN